VIDDDRRQNVFGLLMSLNMLIEVPGGSDYTGADCTTWLREAASAKPTWHTSSGPTRWWWGSSNDDDDDHGKD
jgi:hypothetical protein